jgi:beta-galactosidase/beta-glucuronidase
LWTPEHPNLYDFKFKLAGQKNQEEDALTVRSGFRTFESKNGMFYLNGIPYWLRGGNQTPFALAPNDTTLADTFYQLMKAANIEVTRTHTTPYNNLWIDLADKDGIGISHEGTWPWLMINNTA